jgi:hypothetical protein
MKYKGFLFFIYLPERIARKFSNRKYLTICMKNTIKHMNFV